MKLPAQGRALANRLPPPVQSELRKLSSHGARLTREIFAGILVIGFVIILAGYGRLAQGPITIPSLVPAVEDAINGELQDMHVEIGDAILQRSPDGPGIAFRLKNIRLVDAQGAVLAQAPFAAIGLSGSALLSGRIAPGSVDFIGARLLLFYSDDQGLSLSFSEAAEVDALSMSKDAKGASQASPFGELLPNEDLVERANRAAGQKLNVTETVSEVFEQARKGSNSYLTRFGVEDALVLLSHDGKQTFWQVPDFSVDLKHEKWRSRLVGEATMQSDRGDWRLEFSTVQDPKRNQLAVNVKVEDFVPSSMADKFPDRPALQGLNIPVTANADIRLSEKGQVVSWEAGLYLKPGDITVPWEEEYPTWIDSGEFHLAYPEGQDRVVVEKSTVRWGRSKIAISGAFDAVKNEDGKVSRWDYHLKADEAFLAADEFGVPPIAADELSAKGWVGPAAKVVTVDRLLLREGDAQVQISGRMENAEGTTPAMVIKGQVSSMPAEVFQQFWPKFVAAGAREWSGENVSGGQVLGGTFDINIGPGEVEQVIEHGAKYSQPVLFDMQLENLQVTYFDGMPPVTVPEVGLHLRGASFYADIPQGTITLDSGERIELSDGRYEVADLRPKTDTGVVTFSGDGGLAAVLQLLDNEPLNFMQDMGKDPTSFGGRVRGDFAVTIPLKKDLEPEEISFNGQAKLTDVVAANVVGDLDIQGGTYDVNVTETALVLEGDLVVKEIPAQVRVERLFGVPEESQPPVRISAVLDAAARDKLGLGVNQLVTGLLPVTVSVTDPKSEKPKLSVEADLTNTQLVIAGMGWNKPSGQRATITFDIDEGQGGATVLNDIQMRGDKDINIDGWLALNSDLGLQSFHFSDFSFNALTHLEVGGEMGEDGVLRVKARGPSYDGKQAFRSLFSAGQLADNASGTTGDAMDINMDVQIDNIVGYYGTTLKQARITMSKRGDNLTALDAEGLLNGKDSLKVNLKREDGKRVLRAETANAGDAFRLVGFYRQVQGGSATLIVDMDAGAGDSKSGQLWAQNFQVVSDRVVEDVLSDQQSAAAFGQSKRRNRRDRITFNKLRAPFTVGNGQFMLHDAYMNGPTLGATMRGRVNFSQDTVDLGGTYVPLYGLNSALGQIPLLGNLLVGRQGEGIVGITFAIKGNLSDPAVLVNPMSVVAPGIFRQIFEFQGQPPGAGAQR
ncbi:YhdP family protein [Methyloligella solikamskensis]|uniref:AsmA-like C-terminal region-containing protein n=1 Tax=Methyloligella solikamskensis TaxID=1177756 RepID=A0ABW3JAS6_9HYPH